MKKIERKIFSDTCCWYRTLISVIIILALLVFPYVVYRLMYFMTKRPIPSSHRLSTAVIPSHYRLYIDASQLEEYLFNGNVEIDIRINKEIDEIVLNSLGLNISNVRLHHEAFDFLLQGISEVNHEYEQLKIKFDRVLRPGYGQLYLSFEGQINDQLHGFYRTTTHNQIGACTQFEPAYARRAFPCFDEPSLKSNFTLIIRSPRNLTTLSNMPIIRTLDDTNQTTVYYFETSPIMSTYLVAYVIGRYDYVETRDTNNVSIRVYTPVGKKQQGLYALETAAKILPFYADYFGIKYPLSKLDLIAIADFSSGAMENWGLTTYRETYLLVDDYSTTQKTKQDVSLVVAHELAHQWFGNLVTMEWWNDLWLNEGFATWIEFLAVDYVYPDYDIWIQFVSDILATCMIPDALYNSHSIETIIRKPSDIDEIFDDITYEKGSSVIRLLHAFIGDQSFRTGLSNYLTEYSYRNTITENLWMHLSKASNRSDLSEILSTWTRQMGYPLLIVNEEKRGNTRVLTIEQTRFLADGSNDDTYRWKIPINICTKSSPNQSVYQLFLNSEKKREFLLENLAETDWIKLNLFSVGIYRVHYSSSMLEALKSGIHDHSLSPQDRFNIQSDVYALARAGYIGYVDYLKLLRYAYKHEENLTVWKSILRQLTELSSIFDYAYIDTTKSLYQSYICDLLNLISNRLKWNSHRNENSQKTILRSLVLTHLGLHGDKKTNDEANKRFRKYFIEKNRQHLIDPNIRTAIYLTVAKTGDQQIFNQLKSLYFKADTQEERVRLLTALARFDDPVIQNQALDFIWNTSIVRRQDHLTGFVSLATHNRRGCDIAWEYMKKNWKKIESIYGEHDSHLIHFIENIPSLFVSKERSEEVRKFHLDYPNPFLDRSIKKTIEQINIRRLVLERHEHNINDFLRH